MISSMAEVNLQSTRGKKDSTSTEGRDSISTLLADLEPVIQKAVEATVNILRTELTSKLAGIEKSLNNIYEQV